jgi:glycosyltransferase involved in cell wall biosynthesis
MRWFGLIRDSFVRRLERWADKWDSQRLRRELLQSMRARDMARALNHARALWTHPFGRPEDRARRIQILAMTGKRAVVARYVNWLKHGHASGRAPDLMIAERLYITGHPRSALEVLGPASSWALSPQRVYLAKLCLTQLRRFQELADLWETLGWRRIFQRKSFSLPVHRAFVAAGILTKPGADAAEIAIHHWLTQDLPPVLTPIVGRTWVYCTSLSRLAVECQAVRLMAKIRAEPAADLHVLMGKKLQNPDKFDPNWRDYKLQFIDDPVGQSALPDHATLQEMAALAGPLGVALLVKALPALYALRPEVLHLKHTDTLVLLAAVLAGVPRIVVQFTAKIRGQTEIDQHFESLDLMILRHCVSNPRVEVISDGHKGADFGLPNLPIQAVFNAEIAIHHWLTQDLPPVLTPIARRVVFYSHSLGIGGAERQVTNLISAICADNDASSVHLLLRKQAADAYQIDPHWRDFFLHYIDDPWDKTAAMLPEHPTLQDVNLLSQKLGIAVLKLAIAPIQNLRPEVMHVRGAHAGVVLAAVLAGVPRIVVHFGSMTRGRQSSGTAHEQQREALDSHMLRLCAAFPQVILASNSRAAADDWADSLGIARDQIRVIYNALDLDALGYSPVPFEKPQRQPLVVGGVFRLSPVKDPLLWVKVAGLVHEALPETRFLLVGDGPMRDQVAAAVAEVGLSGQFDMAGLVTSGMIDYLRRMDLSLMTTRTESLPNAVIEAQLAGLPVIAPDVGGISEALATPDTGRLTARNARALADSVIAGLQDPAWRDDVRHRAPALIFAKFSMRRLLAQTKAAYGWVGEHEL